MAKQVTRKVGFKQLNCKYCNRVCERVDLNATAITCYKCTHRQVCGEILELYGSDINKKSKK